MGSFGWDNPCYLQYYNGRPLSVALTEPCACDQKISPCVESDFAVQYQPCRQRSQSTGRRFKRESYRIYHPNVEYASFCYSPPCHRRVIDRSASRDFFVENFVTYEEEQCRPNYGCVSYVCTPSPPVRQVKIRSRPSSCFDLRKKEETENQWVREERRDEHYNYDYNITVPIKRESSKSVHHIGTITAEPVIPKPVRPSMRDATTTTDGLPRKPIRPLSISETQVLDRYEQEERIRRESITEKAGSSISYITTTAQQRPIESSRSVSYLTTTQQQPIESSSSFSYSTGGAQYRPIENSSSVSYSTNAAQYHPIQNSSSISYSTSAAQHRPIESSKSVSYSTSAAQHRATENANSLNYSTQYRPLENTGSFSYQTTSTDRPSHRSYDDDDSHDEQYKRVSTKAQRKDFVQRMHIRNGTASKSYNAFNIYSDYGKNQAIIRPTAKPREALVDAPSIVAPPGASEPSTPITSETTYRSRQFNQFS